MCYAPQKDPDQGPVIGTQHFPQSRRDDMSATQITTTTLPAGTYRLDPVHSSASFAVKHMVVATFRGRFEDFDATLTVDDAGRASLSGVVQVSSLQVTSGGRFTGRALK